MQRPPHNPKESIFARGLGIYILRVGIVFGILTTIMMVIAYRYTPVIRPGELSPDRWKTMVFTTLCLAQMGHVIAIRSSRLTITQPLDHNPWLLLAVTVTTLAQFLLIYVSPLQRFFGTFALSIEDLSICVGFSLLLFVWLEAEKLVRQRNRNSQK
jgi:Ca2+-transporting ATPase